MDKITLQADNRIIKGQRPTVKTSRQVIEQEAKKFFNWRGSTKRYDSVFDRVMGQGSSSFDDFVVYMVEQGY